MFVFNEIQVSFLGGPRLTGIPSLTQIHLFHFAQSANIQCRVKCGIGQKFVLKLNHLGKCLALYLLDPNFWSQKLCGKLIVRGFEQIHNYFLYRNFYEKSCFDVCNFFMSEKCIFYVGVKETQNRKKISANMLIYFEDAFITCANTLFFLDRL